MSGEPQNKAPRTLPESGTTQAAAPRRRLRITEIFHSIQGESSHAGRPSAFVRLTGCNLRCRWCDSEYTFQGGEWMGFDEIFAQLETFPGCRLVEVTGGEPLLQREVHLFMQECLDRGYEVMLETSGSLDISPVPAEVRKIVDLKPPGSGEVAQNDFGNFAHLQPWDELKAVLADRADYEWAVEVCRTHDLLGRFMIHFSPVFGELEPATLAAWILEDGLPVRMQLQLHKFIWDPSARGV